MKVQNRRRIYIVNKKYQFTFISAFILLSIAGVAASSLVINYLVKAGIRENLYRSHLRISHMGQIAFPVTVKIDLIFFTLGAAALTALSLYYYKKNQRLESSMIEGLKRIKEGSLDFDFEIGLRQEFPGLEKGMNLMLEALRERARKYRRASGEIEKCLGEPGLQPERLAAISGEVIGQKA